MLSDLLTPANPVSAVAAADLTHSPPPQGDGVMVSLAFPQSDHDTAADFRASATRYDRHAHYDHHI